MKIIVFIILTLFITGCSEQFPPPEDAIKTCIGKGWIPKYHSTGSFTKFSCEPLEE